ncbi:MAG: alpha-hydroxy-acid oxidizing protein [Legionellales bacterium]|nr:alpha-hydroxy-acid oxidizing protein [Legionellales bacterium]
MPGLASYEALAKKKLEKSIFDYVCGGSGNEITLQSNNAAFQKFTFLPQSLKGIVKVDTSVNLLGNKLKTPVLIAPTAFHKMLHPEGEIAMAKAVENSGSLMIVSTMATTSLEKISQSTQSPLWFQLYVFENQNITLELIRRAENAGYKAIVITVDVPLMATRHRDKNNFFTLPPHCKAENFINFGLNNLSEKTKTGSRVAEYTNTQFKRGLSWQDIDWIKSQTRLPIILKGILNPLDAKKCLEKNIDGIIVSNHGGRQLDCSVSSLEILPHIIQAVQNKIPVLLDGGIKNGADVVKALALGARAVLLGRLPLWALTVGGQQGIQEMFTLINEEIEECMLLLGCESVNELRENGRDYLYFTNSISLETQHSVSIPTRFSRLRSKL